MNARKKQKLNSFQGTLPASMKMSSKSMQSQQNSTGNSAKKKLKQTKKYKDEIG